MKGQSGSSAPKKAREPDQNSPESKHPDKKSRAEEGKIDEVKVDDGAECPAEQNSKRKLVTENYTMNPAPEVLDYGRNAGYLNPTTREIKHNIKYDVLYKPIIGPQNPFTSQNIVNKNTFTGIIEDHMMPNYVFDEMHRKYNDIQCTYNPDPALYPIADAELGVSAPQTAKKKRKNFGDPSDVNGYLGPWAGYEGEPEPKPIVVEEFKPTEVANPAIEKKEKPVIDTIQETSTFHGERERDYQGRTYMHADTDIGVNLHAEPGIKDTFLPKTHIHTYNGHNRAVSAIRLIPKTAHLLLSADTENKAKLWKVYHDRQCLRTFIGHTKGINDINFNNDGRTFLTGSYDKWIKLWDTETGACISRFSNKRIPYCVKFNPDEDKQHLFLAGCSDKRIYQFDIRTGDVVQEYDQHLGAVNTITFFDSNRKFVTTSDDKTLRAWEFDIPVVIKYIAEPSMHSMPAVCLHPKQRWLACQSLDNQIIVYSAGDKFRVNRKKVFRGHLVAGYACEPAFSPDGRFLSSGDSTGKIWFWDWKTCRVLKKFKAHDKVVIGNLWHPHETSKVFTCSWDGTIKLWD